MERPALWRANVSETSWLYGGCRAGLSLGNRCEYRHFECGERLCPAPAAHRKADGISRAILGQKNGRASLGEGFLSKLRGFARAKPEPFRPLRVDGDFGRHQFQRKPQ